MLCEYAYPVSLENSLDFFMIFLKKASISFYASSGVSSVKIFTAFKWVKNNSSASSSVVSSSIEEDAPPNNPSDLCCHSEGGVFQTKTWPPGNEQALKF